MLLLSEVDKLVEKLWTWLYKKIKQWHSLTVTLRRYKIICIYSKISQVETMEHKTSMSGPNRKQGKAVNLYTNIPWIYIKYKKE